MKKKIILSPITHLLSGPIAVPIIFILFEVYANTHYAIIPLFIAVAFAWMLNNIVERESRRILRQQKAARKQVPERKSTHFDITLRGDEYECFSTVIITEEESREVWDWIEEMPPFLRTRLYEYEKFARLVED